MNTDIRELLLIDLGLPVGHLLALIEMVLKIKDLLYNRGFTIPGARKQLSKTRSEHGAQRDKVLIHVRKELRDILTLLRRKP